MSVTKIFHQSNLRKHRQSIAGNYYALTVCTKDKKPIFLDHNCARKMSRCLSADVIFSDATFMCWVVMPDHWHALIKLGEDGSLNKIAQRIKCIAAKEINLLLGKTGEPLWQKGYYERKIRNDQDVMNACSYILHNPIRAGIVESIGDYPYWNCIWHVDEATVKWSPSR